MRFAVLLTALLEAASLSAGEIKGAFSVESSSGADKPAVVWLEGLSAPIEAKRKVAISQKNIQFDPGFQVVVMGETVEFPNDDNITHNVFSYSPPKKFNLGLYPKGQSRSVTFNQPGWVDVFCSIHRNMNAKVLVVTNPHFQVVTGKRQYELKDVPPGNYTLHAWSKGAVEQTKKVAVSAAGSVTENFVLETAEDK